MADDERRAEIEAVAEAIALHEGYRPDEMPEGIAAERELAEKVLAALDRVRDARGDDEGRGPYDFPGPPDLPPVPDDARSPQDKDHEAECHCGSADHTPAQCPDNSLPSPSRDGTVAVEDAVYVAGRTSDVERVRRVQQMFRDRGYRVTFDWTGPDGEIRSDWGGIASERGAALSRRELEAVREAAITVLPWKDPTDNRQGMVGALIEAGAALASGRRLWVVGPSRDSVFFHHANARVFDNESALAEALAKFSPASTGDRGGVMADDDRRAEIEAVGRAICAWENEREERRDREGILRPASLLNYEDWRDEFDDQARVAIAALDRVRDARCDDEAGRCEVCADAPYPWNCERCNPSDARSPQGEDHEGAREKKNDGGRH